MKQPSKLMKRALRRPRYNVTFTMTDPPDATQRVRVLETPPIPQEAIAYHTYLMGVGVAAMNVGIDAMAMTSPGLKPGALTCAGMARLDAMRRSNNER